ncbi:MAG: MAPEG family protein [Chthoniobacterales bacterium]
MTTEFEFLAASVILGLVHLIADSHLISSQYGYRWTASTREQPVPPLRGLASRVDQAYVNFMETFPFFAALVLVAHVAGRDSTLTLWGAHLYFWGRLGYLLAAAMGYGLVRSIVFFNTALPGLCSFSLPCYGKGRITREHLEPIS